VQILQELVFTIFSVELKNYVQQVGIRLTRVAWVELLLAKLQQLCPPYSSSLSEEA
jgi:hypothetical protein